MISLLSFFLLGTLSLSTMSVNMYEFLTRRCIFFQVRILVSTVKQSSRHRMMLTITPSCTIPPNFRTSVYFAATDLERKSNWWSTTEQRIKVQERNVPRANIHVPIAKRHSQTRRLLPATSKAIIPKWKMRDPTSVRCAPMTSRVCSQISEI